MFSIEGIGVEKVGQSQSEGPAKGNNQRSVKFHKPVIMWDMLSACHIQNDKLEAYPTFKDAPELKSRANEQRRSATLAIRTSPGSLQAPNLLTAKFIKYAKPQAHPFRLFRVFRGCNLKRRPRTEVRDR